MKSELSPYTFLPRPATPSRGNVTAHVTDTLRSAIVSLQLKPGEQIDKGAICEQLGVSRFPVSEALARLQAEGLVDILPQRGSTVSLVRIADVREYMLIRKALESEAVRVLVGNHDPALIDALQHNMGHQRTAAETNDSEGFHQRDLEFHDLIYSAMRLNKVKTVIESTRSNLDRARRLILAPRRVAFSMREHQAILDGIIADDAARASMAMRSHIDTVMAELLVFARETPELFADGDTLSGVDDKKTFPFG